MLGNIIDHRTNSNNVQVDAVYEPSCHDNGVAGATRFPREGSFLISQLYDTTLAEAVAHAAHWPEPVTVYLYDAGSRPAG